tara:strand:+ start:2107 stop:2535 length:429 start_codon:yes stop_codon:yes gene_type:complete
MYKKLLDSRAGLEHCLKYLKEHINYKWSHIVTLNKSRYYVAFGFNDCPNVAILFKTQWYESYGDNKFINDNGQVETGIGDSINSEHIKQMIEQGVKDIYTVHEKGDIYTISMKDFLLKSHPRNAKERRVRSFSIHNYKRVNK